MVLAGRASVIEKKCLTSLQFSFQTLTNVVMATASSYARMSPDPILVRATLVLPSTRMGGLAKVCDVRDNWNLMCNEMLSSSEPDSLGGWVGVFLLPVTVHPSPCLQKPEIPAEVLGKVSICAECC